MRQHLLVTPVSLLLLLATTTPLRAQDRATVDASGGYAFSHITNGDGTSMPAGWFASVGAYVSPAVAIVGEGTGSYKSESTSFSNAGITFSSDTQLRLYTFQAGPRFSGRTSKARPFAQFLVGGATISASGTARGIGFSAASDASKTYFAVTPGGGVDVYAGPHFGVRFLANFQFIRGDGNDWGKVLHTGVGLVWTNK